jgi:hypothetical protein
MPVEFIVGAVVGGAAVSRRVRQALRKSLIYGVGGALVAYDKVAAMAHGVRGSVHRATAPPENVTANGPVSPNTASETNPQTVSVSPSAPAGTPS